MWILILNERMDLRPMLSITIWIYRARRIPRLSLNISTHIKYAIIKYLFFFLGCVYQSICKKLNEIETYAHYVNKNMHYQNYNFCLALGISVWILIILK